MTTCMFCGSRRINQTSGVCQNCGGIHPLRPESLKPPENLDVKGRNRHFVISLIKSGLRIVAGGAFMAAWYSDCWQLSHVVFVGGVLLVAAEILGIAEEL